MGLLSQHAKSPSLSELGLLHAGYFPSHTCDFSLNNFSLVSLTALTAPSVIRRQREGAPRPVARLVPVIRLISIARPVKVFAVTPGIIARSIGTRRVRDVMRGFLLCGFRAGTGPGATAIV
jgi:hypothetical protein